MSGIDWNSIAREARTRFGITRFRLGQRALIEAVLTGRDALGIMPTGGGKSLAYQLPALFLPKTTVVVSPLIALMQDQQAKAIDANLAAVKIDSTLTDREQRAAAAEIADGDVRIVYVTPERLEDPDYVTLLRNRGVSRLVIDEAHCISQSGHDFRPAYLALRDVVRRLGRPPVLALTATAPEPVTRDILQQLDIAGAQIVNTGADRENLILDVRRTPTDAAKRGALLRILQTMTGPTIVYAATVRVVDQLWSWLRDRGYSTTRYHGELKPREREQAQTGFMENRFRIVVATKAFGLGIDKPDIRLVVHYHFPDSPETYYQEAGRAGRDDRPARAILLYQLEDRRIQSYFLGGKYPRHEDSQKVYEALLAGDDNKTMTPRELVRLTGLSERRIKVIVAQLELIGILQRRGRRLQQQRAFANPRELDQFLHEYERRAAAERERLDAIMHYAQSALCRMRYLRNYLGDHTEIDCNRCDNCRQRASPPRRVMRAPKRITAKPVDPARPNKGQRVWHARFGEGEILDNGGEHFTVNFPRVGVKRILASYLKPNP